MKYNPDELILIFAIMVVSTVIYSTLIELNGFLVGTLHFFLLVIISFIVPGIIYRNGDKI